MNFTKMIYTVVVLLSINNLYAMDIHKYIEAHKSEPEALRDVLIHMGQWETPDLAAARKILSLGINANAKDKGNIALDNPGWTALTTAASHGHTAYVELLLDAGADIEIKDPWDGRTALMAASLNGHSEAIRLLLKRGASPNATNCYKRTALIWAAEHAHVDAVKLLLAAKANVEAKDEEEYHAYDKDGKWIQLKGKTALAYAKEAHFSQYQDRYDEIVKLLENAGAKE